MMRVDRWALTLVLILVCASFAGADVVLVDERVDRDEITEIRFDAPAGCVITGLGFRANADNITTMHCRYHRVAADGTLVDPQEAHLGSEPDHGCEAKVLLPDGWVAVGFGAAGEPEWDVTLLRVWGRKLNPDGRLGEAQVFNAGRKPDRGPERFVLLEETDRALTGVGIRFHRNDIGGIYGRSCRILDLGDDDRAKLRGLKVSGWLIDGTDDLEVDTLLADMEQHNVGRLDIRLASGRTATPDRQVEILKGLVSRCRQAEIDTYLWTKGMQPDRALDLIRAMAGLAGIVVDISGLPSESFPAARLDKMLEASRKANLRLYLSTSHIPEWMGDLPKEVGVVLSSDLSARETDSELLAGRDVLAELEVTDPIALAAGLPDVRIAQAAGRVVEAALAGARGFIVDVHYAGQYLPGSVSSIALEAAAPLVADPLRDTDAVWNDLCRARYGAAGPQAKSVLQEATLANDLIFGMLGVHFLWQDRRLASLPGARERLQRLAEGPVARLQQSARSLLTPDDAAAGRVELEGETALWHVKQCLSGAEEALKAAPGPQTQALSKSIARLQQSARLSQAASMAFIETQLYAQDAAPRTLAAAQAALESLRAVAGEASSTMPGSPMLQGLELFMASVRKSLEESPKSAPIALAFQRVRELSAAGQDDEAAQALADILNDQRFAKHLDKHWQTVGEIASSLRALGMADGELSVRWGGDGRWRLEKTGGRWGCATHEGGPCLYLDVAGGPLKPAADYVLSFEYYDAGDWEFSVQYDSDHPADQNRPYYPAGPVKLTDTKTWKQGSLVLTKCLFSGGENMESDLRFLSGKGVCIRAVKLAPK